MYESFVLTRQAAIPGWTPMMLGNKLVVWFDPNFKVILSGLNVIQWIDRILGLTLTVGGGTPTWSSSARNGTAGITFSGAGGTYMTSGASPGLPAGNAPYAMAVSHYLASTTGNSAGYQSTVNWAGTGSANNRRQMGAAFVTAPPCLGYIRNEGSECDVTAGDCLTTDRFHYMFGDTTQLGIWRDGQSPPDTNPYTSAADDGAQPLLIGGQGGAFWDGVIHHVLIFNNTLTTDERMRLEGWDSWTTGKQGTNLPSTHPYKTAPPA